MRTAGKLGALLGCLALAACGTPTSKSNNGSNNTTSNNTTSNNTTSNNTTGNNGTTCKINEPEFHRPDPAECDNDRGPGMVSNTNGTMLECTEDADCTDGLNGRCVSEPRSGFPYCSYDQCLTDDDCDGGLCECGGGEIAPNVCQPGNCVTDADCGDTGYCSPTQGDCGAYVGTVGYYCHTCDDECVTDADCGGDPYTTYCAYDPGVGHWRCSDAQCVG